MFKSLLNRALISSMSTCPLDETNTIVTVSSM